MSESSKFLLLQNLELRKQRAKLQEENKKLKFALELIRDKTPTDEVCSITIAEKALQELEGE